VRNRVHHHLRAMIVAAYLLTCIILVEQAASEEHRRFSVKDDIELTQFGDVYFWIRGDLAVSPAGDKVLVHTTRASLEDGAVHDELRVYSTAEIRTYVNAPASEKPPAPIWNIEESRVGVGGDGPLMSDLHWLDDESGVAFLLRTDAHHRRLYLTTLDSHALTPLTSDQDDVLAFSIRSKSHFVFTVGSRESKENLLGILDAPFQVGTGKRFWDVMSPERRAYYIGRGDLWAADGGPPAPVINAATGRAVVLYESGSQNLALSPDGKKLVTIQAVHEIPKEWESRYPPPFPGDPYRMRAGVQDLNAPGGYAYVGEYVSIALNNGTVTPLTNAPTAAGAGWFEEGPATPAWSDDGTRVLLPGSFMKGSSRSEGIPFVVVIDMRTATAGCVRPLKRELASGFEPGYARSEKVGFERGKDDEVVIKSVYHENDHREERYRRLENNVWEPRAPASEDAVDRGVEMKVVATFKDPPLLIATDTKTRKSRTVLDPNPQLKGIAIGEPELYSWQDRARRNWQGILFKPVDFHSGVKYPLVIQNHGFSEDRFAPSGAFPSAFVAEELASAGIMVLQVRDCAGRGTPDEGPCNVEGYEAAVEKLSKEGMIDPAHLGIIGFSRTVYYVLEALTTSRLHFEAASITDGINVGYTDYLHSSDTYRKEAEAMIGSAPLGSGLLDWIKRSPLFNMDRVTTPLRVVATRSGSLIEMWEPYALLDAMHKPVDLIVLNTNEHVITDPKIRLAAQGGNLDWFRFWLQGYEDPDPAKAEQYARWQTMRGAQGTR
jgi:hypothetical protein